MNSQLKPGNHPPVSGGLLHREDSERVAPSQSNRAHQERERSGRPLSIICSVPSHVSHTPPLACFPNAFPPCEGQLSSCVLHRAASSPVETSGLSALLTLCRSKMPGEVSEDGSPVLVFKQVEPSHRTRQQYQEKFEYIPHVQQIHF